MELLGLLAILKNYKYWIVLVLVAASFAGGYVASRFLPADSPIEQACEKIIQSQTGIDIDFSVEK